MSYCETAWTLFAFANDAVAGFPAYTFPAVPLELNGEPCADAEPPGVNDAFAFPHVVAGAPG
jgi:hypothetical protein